VVGFSYVKILAPAYFAREDTKTPVRAGLIALAVNFVLSVALAWYLTSIGYAGTHAGLALAISVAAMLNALLLYRGLIRDAVLRHSAGWSALLLQVSAANAAMWIVLAWLDRRLEWWLDVASLDRVTWLAISIAAGAGVYCVTLLVLGLRTSKLGIKPH
jgi:putative peptidoglycan lipid II flippase